MVNSNPQSGGRYWFNDFSRNPSPQAIGNPRAGKRQRYSFVQAGGRRKWHSEIWKLGRQFHPKAAVE